MGWVTYCRRGRHYSQVVRGTNLSVLCCVLPFGTVYLFVKENRSLKKGVKTRLFTGKIHGNKLHLE